ncbi:MAG: dethiobiotin synthase [Propionibacteriaceae bacterium]
MTIPTSGITFVTGTDTDVGKTVATAVLAAYAQQNGIDVVVIKPAQTGLIADEPNGDSETVAYLAGLNDKQVQEWSRLPEPLAPTTAAHRAGVQLPDVAEIADRLCALANQHEQLLVEGAGGVLVGIDSAGATLIDLGKALIARGITPATIVVARSGLGTLNHTGLTVNALRDAGLPVAGIIIGSWPQHPDLASSCNRDDLTRIAPLLACLPENIGTDPTVVQQVAAELVTSTPQQYRQVSARGQK